MPAGKKILAFVFFTVIALFSCSKPAKTPRTDVKSKMLKMAGMHYWAGTYYHHFWRNQFIDTSYNVTDTFLITILNDTTISDSYSTLASHFTTVNDTEIVFAASDFYNYKYNLPFCSINIAYNYINGVINYTYSNDTSLITATLTLHSL